MTMTAPAFALCAMEVTTHGAAADVRLNDIPVTMVGLPGGAGQAFIPVPAEVVNGSNRLAAMVMAVPDQPPAGAKVQIRIAIFGEGDLFFSNAGRELIRLDWAAVPERSVLNREFVVDFGPTQWSWGRCAVWSDPVEALADAMPFVRKLATAYYASDSDWLARASVAQFADMALAFPAIPIAEQMAQIATVIRSDPPETVPDRQPPQPVLCCDRRLLMLIGPDGRPWLRKQGPGARGTGAKLMLGKIAGEWQIIR